MIATRALAAVHFVYALFLLPVTLLGGILFFPLLGAVPIWVAVLGRRLWIGETGALVTARRTHYGLLAFGALLVAWGLALLKAAEASAARGGGLLGGFGLIPIAFGGVIGLASLGLLPWIVALSRRRPAT